MSTTNNTHSKFAGSIPEYIEAAACEIYEALHAFLRYDHIPNPNGGPDVPWVAEIRIPVAREINPKTGVTYTSVEAAWFDKERIEDLAAVLASDWCQPPGILDDRFINSPPVTSRVGD